jgi:hypothetical protein
MSRSAADIVSSSGDPMSTSGRDSHAMTSNMRAMLMAVAKQDMGQAAATDPRGVSVTLAEYKAAVVALALTGDISLDQARELDAVVGRIAEDMAR